MKLINEKGKLNMCKEDLENKWEKNGEINVRVNRNNPNGIDIQLPDGTIFCNIFPVDIGNSGVVLNDQNTELAISITAPDSSVED